MKFSSILTRGAAAAALSLGLTASADAAIIQLGSFESMSGEYTYAAGSLTGTTSGNFTFDPATVAEFGVPPGTFAGATLTVSANRTGNAVPTGPVAYQAMDGFIEVKNGLDVLIRADFTNALFGGFLGSFVADLTGDTSFSTITYSSTVLDASRLIDPQAFKFTLNPLPTPLALNGGGNFQTFRSPDAANFSSDFTSVPEPASMTLLGLSMVGAAFAARRRRQ